MMTGLHPAQMHLLHSPKPCRANFNEKLTARAHEALGAIETLAVQSGFSLEEVLPRMSQGDTGGRVTRLPPATSCRTINPRSEPRHIGGP